MAITMLDQKLYVKECKANWCGKNLDLVNNGRNFLPEDDNPTRIPPCWTL